MADTVSFQECTINAARLLRNAETVTDLALMERLEKVADSWISLGHLIDTHDESD